MNLKVSSFWRKNHLAKWLCLFNYSTQKPNTTVLCYYWLVMFIKSVLRLWMLRRELIEKALTIVAGIIYIHRWWAYTPNPLYRQHFFMEEDYFVHTLWSVWPNTFGEKIEKSRSFFRENGATEKTASLMLQTNSKLSLSLKMGFDSNLTHFNHHWLASEQGCQMVYYIVYQKS
jgi:hypothetical protein